MRPEAEYRITCRECGLYEQVSQGQLHQAVANVTLEGHKLVISMVEPEPRATR